MVRNDLRNVAIIAHVDHGKTTLVDEMLKQGGAYREHQEVVERVMDSNDLERERGITILAKNTAVRYGDTKINIVDTPGHADFGGEVERVLKMVNGVILLVDAAEGPMPQTRFVLSKALELGHRVIVVINKIDRPDQRIHEVIDEVLELLMDLNATDEQLDSPMLFCSGRQGTASYSPDVPGKDLRPLFETILEYIPAPEQNVDAPFQMLVSSIDYNEFVGRIAIGRIERGVIHQNEEIAVCNYHQPDAPAKKAKAVSMYEFEGLQRVPVTEAEAGSIIAMSGIGDITIGDTICAPSCVEPIEFVKISAPTMEMTPVGSRMKIEFLVPSRGLFGYRNEFLTDTRGEGIMASVFDSYAPYKGDLSRRNTGSLVSFETGESVGYGLFNAQERGALFIGPGVPVYEGMIVGVSPKQEDITVNVCKKKQMTNMRAAGSDEALRLVPPRKMSLEQCLEFLADDELLEVTPKSLRMRKTILNHEKRMKATHGGKKN